MAAHVPVAKIQVRLLVLASYPMVRTSPADPYQPAAGFRSTVRVHIITASTRRRSGTNPRSERPTFPRADTKPGFKVVHNLVLEGIRHTRRTRQLRLTISWIPQREMFSRQHWRPSSVAVRCITDSSRTPVAYPRAHNTIYTGIRIHKFKAASGSS